MRQMQLYLYHKQASTHMGTLAAYTMPFTMPALHAYQDGAAIEIELHSNLDDIRHYLKACPASDEEEPQAFPHSQRSLDSGYFASLAANTFTQSSGNHNCSYFASCVRDL